ncbi:flavin reductase family protein [Fictibacillus fluitans]|uniref:Flavin reductase family protein n=1 Tax=Fictibacillus fluitans TaxID=3058422 RepID=A0ABT8HXV5_9BACL|nr:flavin reductase family protein [Fictibacillus sp. NE201]MDN4525610.1 flavin reductase family protein [Fictibacillus sp. NE201]
MKSIDPSQLSDRENYKFLTGSVIPRPVAFVTSLTKEGILNAAPFSYFNIVSSSPPLISVSVQRSNGKPKDTARNAMEAGEFVVHISDESYVEAINKTAASLPPDESEVELATLTPVESTSVGVPGLQEASIRLECVLDQSIPLGGNDENPSCDLLIGRVVHYHIKEDLYHEGRIDAAGLKPVSRLAGNNYSRLGDVFTLERPK